MDVIQKVAWRSTPPPSVVYHDYAWWHEKEVCPLASASLSQVAASHKGHLALGSMGRGLKGRMLQWSFVVIVVCEIRCHRLAMRYLPRAWEEFGGS